MRSGAYTVPDRLDSSVLFEIKPTFLNNLSVYDKRTDMLLVIVRHKTRDGLSFFSLIVRADTSCFYTANAEGMLIPGNSPHKFNLSLS
jgi:hypothetical protein